MMEFVITRWEKYPQLKVTVDQLHDTKANAATQGTLISVFPESRQKIVSGMESLYQGMDPQKALDQAAKETDRALKTEGKKQGK
jgi:sn-glycerol 3-phosphate transport system substrate-binding protein